MQFSQSANCYFLLEASENISFLVTFQLRFKTLMARCKIQQCVSCNLCIVGATRKIWESTIQPLQDLYPVPAKHAFFFFSLQYVSLWSFRLAGDQFQLVCSCLMGHTVFRPRVIGTRINIPHLSLLLKDSAAPSGLNQITVASPH